MPKHEYDYYSGESSEQFRFLRVPWVFFEDPDYAKLGSDERLLYGLLHSQVDYSRRNGWIDSEGRTYVLRSIESIQKFLHDCSEDKARNTLKNLIDFGLIEKKRRGQGKGDLIYVKDFVTKDKKKSDSKKSDDCGKLFSETENNGVLNEEKTDSGVGKNRILELAETGPNKNNNNLNNIIEPNHNPIQVTGNITRAAEPVDNSGWDEDEIQELIDQIEANIDYYDYSPRYKAEYNHRYEEMYEIIVEEVVGRRKSQIIGGTEYPQCIIKKRFLSLNASHIEYVMWKISEHLGEIRNIKKYTIAALFNAPTTMDNFYTQLVHHDMHSDEWFEMLEKKKKEEKVEIYKQIEELELRQLGVLRGNDQNEMRRAVNE